MNATQDLLLEFYELTKDFDFPERIQVVLELDYLKNHRLYNEQSIANVAMNLIIDPDVPADEAIKYTRCAVER